MALNLCAVTGTLTDPLGVPLAGATVMASFVPTSDVQLATYGGFHFQTKGYTSICDSNGTFAMSLPANDSILPAGSQWNFSVQPVTGTPFNLSISCNGASTSVSTTLSAAASNLAIAGLSEHSFGAAKDTILFRDGAAGVLSQRNANNDQKYRIYGANGGFIEEGVNSELITLSTVGLTTDSVANLLPANSIIQAVIARVITTITTATDWTLGDSSTGNRFLTSGNALTAGTTKVGLTHFTGTIAAVQAAAAKLRVTAVTSNPGAGSIRVSVFYTSFTPHSS